MVDNTRHLVLVSFIGWGHLRGLCVLAAETVKSRANFHVTFFTARSTFDKVYSEISRNLEEEHLLDRIQVVALAEDTTDLFNLEQFDKSFVEQFHKLVDSKTAWCAKREADILVGAGRVPDAVLVDLFAYDQLVQIRAMLPKTKVYCWSPCPTHGTIPLLGPLGADTRGFLRNKVNERMMIHSESLLDAAYEVIRLGRSDKIIEAPGVPAMYDYEVAPQKFPFGDMKFVGLWHLHAADLYHEADGLIIPTIESYDPPESLAYMRKFLGYTNRKLYVLGPLLSAVSGTNAVKQQTESSGKFKEIEAFLARTLESKGPRSLVYMAFGSAFWSAEPEKIWAFVETMLEKRIPFIMAHSSPFAQVPSEIQEKVEASGIGLLTPWAPQQLILDSIVTGWFVSHCGINSTMEAIAAGVPMIAWPFGAEQSFNAANSTENLNIAYELFEVRSGNALKVLRKGKTYTGTVAAVREEASKVLDLAFSEDGEKKRQNVLKLKEAAEQAWSDDGQGRNDFEELLSGI